MSSLKKLFSDTMIYGVSSIVGRFLNYLLVPLYTYKIAATSGGYGIVTEIYAYTALMLVILTFGMETTFFYFANKYRERSDTVFSTALTAVGSVSALFLLLLFGFIKPIAHALGYDAHPEFLTIMGCVVALDAFQAILYALLRFQGRPIKFACLKLLFIFCNIGLNLFVFLVAPGLYEHHPQWMGWYNPDYQVGYIFVVNLICVAGITLGFIPELGKLRCGVDWKVLKEMLRYTWPLLLFGIAGILNQVADKICFNHLVPGPEGKVQLGIYGSCVKIAMIMALITQAFRYAYEPFVFGGGRDRNSKETQALVMKYFVIFAMLAFLAVMAYLDVLKYFIAPSYWEGLRVVPIVMMAEVFMSVYFNLSFWYKLIEQTWWGAVFSAIGCAVLLAINIIFVPRYGYMACAWGGLAGYGVCMVLSYLVGRKKSPVPYKLLPLAGYTALSLGLYGISVWLAPAALGWRLAFNTLLLGVYIVVVLYCERDLIKLKTYQIEK
ncbi:MAG: lipopolysaccharide biosynthesis protein [Bacteroidales bacterium]|nr:lipopolysaccharide biosynthesis protein [Bacteroidales bacterium]